MAGAVKPIDDTNFDDVISKGVTLVDFYANWCGPCRMITPIMEELANDYGNKVTIAKLDVDQAQEAAGKLNVTSIPTVILFKDGQEVTRVVGVRDKNTFTTMLNATVA
jgi:thioredoxin 1